jgi:hypothetical protein
MLFLGDEFLAPRLFSLPDIELPEELDPLPFRRSVPKALLRLDFFLDISETPAKGSNSVS